MSAALRARAEIERTIGKHRRHVAEGTSIGGESAAWHETCIAALLGAIAIIVVELGEDLGDATETPPPVRAVEIPAGHAMIAGQIVKLP